MKGTIFKFVTVLSAIFLIVAGNEKTTMRVEASELNVNVSSNNVWVSPGSAATIQCSLYDTTENAQNLQYIVSNPECVSATWVGFSNNIGALQLNYLADGEAVIAVFDQNNQQDVNYIHVTTSTSLLQKSNGITISHTGQLHDEKGMTATIQDITVTKDHNGEYDRLQVKITPNVAVGSTYNMFPHAIFYDEKGNVLKEQVEVLAGISNGSTITAEWFIKQHTTKIVLK